VTEKQGMMAQEE